MDALDVYTKRNIYDYLARPEAKFDKEYSEERKKLDSTLVKMILLQNVMVEILIGTIF